MQSYGLNQCWFTINTNSEMCVKKKRFNNNQDIPAEEKDMGETALSYSRVTVKLSSLIQRSVCSDQ